ncbi:hypothetical protein JHJ32_19555 [Parapedobacter sp. ISTM3]|uniref:Uncharacterized protein n=1 Tax=Parapedobacter luteus TaxID=623280 RepID=A0A1T5F3B0_9SPHI|nr:MULTISPECIES: hypothetical protein [Parapedobacter]MBK1442202.1 hypothetical protein [Parapedobacter sp. ISTM3]SKB90606.1 hypothetical protein SAMN05660226_03743 [Parapedobacter luteus]
MDNNEQKKTPVDQDKQERGIAENERANYSGFPADEENPDKEKDDPSIRETDDVKKTDTGASDLAGTASGNLEPDDLPDTDNDE